MNQVVAFRTRVESALDDLSDEVAVLKAIEGWPHSKLDTLRQAGSTYASIKAIEAELTHLKRKCGMESWSVRALQLAQILFPISASSSSPRFLAVPKSMNAPVLMRWIQCTPRASSGYLMLNQLRSAAVSWNLK